MCAFILRLKAWGYKTLALTLSKCVVGFWWLARVTLAHIIDGNDPETVGHVGPKREASPLLVSWDSLQLFPASLLRTLVLKLYHILCREGKRESGRNGGERGRKQKWNIKKTVSDTLSLTEVWCCRSNFKMEQPFILSRRSRQWRFVGIDFSMSVLNLARRCCGRLRESS